jgi:cohesin loading factor subunit SCC2
MYFLSLSSCFLQQAEESRFDSGEAAAKMDADGKVTVSKRVSGDQNGDATVFGGVLNKQ